MLFDKAIAKIKRMPFFAPQCSFSIPNVMAAFRWGHFL